MGKQVARMALSFRVSQEVYGALGPQPNVVARRLVEAGCSEPTGTGVPHVVGQDSVALASLAKYMADMQVSVAELAVEVTHLREMLEDRQETVGGTGPLITDAHVRKGRRRGAGAPDLKVELDDDDKPGFE